MSDESHPVGDIPEADRIEQLTPVEPTAHNDGLVPSGPAPDTVDHADWLDQQLEVDDSEDYYPHGA